MKHDNRITAEEETEYAIWGYPPGYTEQQLLVSAYNDGTPITSRAEVDRIVKNLAEKHGCTRITVQDMSIPPNFADPRLLNI